MPANLSKGEVNRAGEVLRAGQPDSLAFMHALRVMQEWRNLHAVPLNSVNMSMRKVTQGFEGNPLVARRLKRAPTIVNKLKTNSGMALARMHDIAGARVILDDCIALRRLVERLDESRIRHSVHRDYDYLTTPKPDGYRSLHRVYRFKGSGPTVDHDGLLVEVQLRTRTQHAWATAVETVGTFLRQSLKRREGDQDWLSFFRHIGSAFAYLEGENPDPAIGFTRDELFGYVREEARRLGVKRKLAAFAKALGVSSRHSNRGVFLLHLRGGPDSDDALALDVHSYPLSRFAEAEAAYRRMEETAGSSDDVVLVSAASTNGLKRAYPNYFLDTGAFLGLLERVCHRSRRNARRIGFGSPQLLLPVLGSTIQSHVDAMPRLEEADALLGRRVLARVLWALELGRRASMGPLAAAAIAQLLRAHTTASMYDTNVARFFREIRGDQRFEGLWSVEVTKEGLRYCITDEGRRLLITLEANLSEANR